RLTGLAQRFQHPAANRRYPLRIVTGRPIQEAEHWAFVDLSPAAGQLNVAIGAGWIESTRRPTVSVLISDHQDLLGSWIGELAEGRDRRGPQHRAGILSRGAFEHLDDLILFLLAHADGERLLEAAHGIGALVAVARRIGL